MSEDTNNPNNDMNDNHLENVIDQYSFDDVGGLSKQKTEMIRYAKAIANSEIFDRYGIKPPKGIILYGRPGSGKTLLAKAFASEIFNYVPKQKQEFTNILFGTLNLEDFVSKYVGETSKNLNKALMGFNNIINQNYNAGYETKIIAYLDEMDAICAKRDETHDSYQKMLGVLLKYMDGMNSDPNVYFIGSTNRIESLDNAIIRPGRFDKKIKVDDYDKGGIKDIFDIHINKYEEKSDFNRLFDRRINWNRIINEIEPNNPSGAEISEIVRRCVEYSLWRKIDRNEDKIPLRTKHISKEIELFYGNKKKIYDNRRIGF